MGHLPFDAVPSLMAEAVALMNRRAGAAGDGNETGDVS
jgi:hypothetical protein